MCPLLKGVSETTKRKRYDKEFDLEAARLVVEHWYAQAEAARRGDPGVVNRPMD